LFEIIIYQHREKISHSYKTFDDMLEDFFWMRESEEHFFEGVKVNGKWLLDNKKNVFGIRENNESIILTLGNSYLLSNDELILDKNNTDHAKFYNTYVHG
jgi:hypothetical protein